ncbi:hypothetical protein [uncultured Hydrogenophaga sp.]|jgi:hypothetical protein|uniref:hypothetical protein n=1 Tax=uncultured Hydrogenophaga sp. TaxID=199683 RepID=UPI00258E14C9|nr:hypothetical protein [uncultured Hydrogenophaga sp.]
MRAISPVSTLSSTTFGRSSPNSPRASVLPLGLYDELRCAVRDNNVHGLKELLNGRVFDVDDTQWLHSLETREFAQNSHEAVQLLRSVKAGEAFQGIDNNLLPTARADTPGQSGSLTASRVEYATRAFQRGDMDELKNVLDGLHLSMDEVFFLVQLGTEHTPD